MRVRVSTSQFRSPTAALLVFALTAPCTLAIAAQNAAPEQQSSSSSATPPAADVGGMSRHDLLTLLYSIYDQSYRFGDAVEKLPAANWKFSGRKRQAFYDKASSVRASVTDLRKPWDAFYQQPDDLSRGEATLKAVKSVTKEMNDFIVALAGTPGASQASEFKPLATGVADSERQLEAYVTALKASAKPPEPATGNPAEAAAQPTAPAAAPSAAPSAPPPPGAESPATAPASASNEPAAPNPPQPAAAEAPAAGPVAMQPADVQALLYKIYVAVFRLNDLAGSLSADKWNLSGPDQASFAARRDSLRDALAAAEKSRSQFNSHPQDSGLAEATSSALQALPPKVDDLVATLASTPASKSATEFKQAESDLDALDHQLDPYVAYLAEKSRPATTAGGAALETEKINVPANVAPLNAAVVEAPPEDQAQVKTMLYKAYVPAFRLKDMLAQERPDQWRASQADRTSYEQAAKTLSDRIADLEKWRDQVDAHPDSLEAAFEAYASLGKLVGPADVVGRLVGQYGNAAMGAEYGQRAEQVDAARDQLEPYLDYLLRHHDRSSGAIERDFVACENQLSYAMRPGVQQAVAMKNINPVFRGRGKRTSRSAPPPGKKTSTKEKQKKKPASPATPATH